VLIVTKQSEDDLANWLGTEWGFIEGLCRLDGEPIVLEPYQTHFLQDRSRFRWIVKSRQVGFSFIMALEALARCHLKENHTAVFVSFNLDEAKERILQARQVHEELPLAFQKRLVVDSKTELAFESNGPNKRLSRILSLPSKAPRGMKGTAYLDEMAHYLADREVYRGTTALILRSDGQLTGSSTPLGRRGIFWEIAKEELRKYPHHSRQFVPWWLCRFFCNDPAHAARAADQMSTEDRVAEFGKPPIHEQLESLALEDFQQEFENSFVDESYSFYPYELILGAMSDDVRLVSSVERLPTPRGRFVAGFDVGRTRDRSELAVFEEIEGRFICRMLRSFDGVPFSEQEVELRGLLNTVPIARLSIDRSGIGMNLAENLARDYPNVLPEDFTNNTKERWATDLKILLQHRDIMLPRDRELVSQFHSIRRRVLPSGKVSFDAERTGKGHADRFWAVALACQKERTLVKPRIEVGARVIG
jgi:phage FluMu gp28-like protein